MKKIFIISFLFFTAINFSLAQSVPYRVVFDVTSHDTTDHRLAIRWATEVLNATPDAQVELVFYGKSMDMITKDKSTVADAITKLSEKKNIAFRVCAIALKNNHLDTSQLVTGVGTVPDGIYEIISKQAEGWGYIKVSH